MKVFISWSGERSQALAQAIREWLPLVLHFVEPWLSQSDINAGERWAVEISKQLEESNFGIICVTPENISSAWILFEAGALAKSMEQGRVIPLLFGIDHKEVTGPLSQFQAKKAEKTGISELVESLNGFCEAAVPDSRRIQLFDALWSTLESKIRSIPIIESSVIGQRPEQDILEELVQSVRAMELRLREESHERGSFLHSVRGMELRVSDAMRTRALNSEICIDPTLVRNMIRKHVKPEMDARDVNSIQFLVLMNYFREKVPWLYELGIDVYRAARDDESNNNEHARRRFLAVLKLVQKEEFLKECGGEDKEFSDVARQTEHLLRAIYPPPDFDDEIPF